MIVSAVNVPRPAGATGPLRLVPAIGPVAGGLRGLAPPAEGHPVGEDPVLAEELALSHALYAYPTVQESRLWEGDLLRFPDCTLVVSVPRLPDARFNETLGFPQAARMVAQSRWCGFWLSVRVPGTIAAGQPFELIPGPRATGVEELFRARTAKMAW